MKLREELHAGQEIDIQIAPFGEYPASTISGKQIVQKFDEESFKRIVQSWIDDGKKMIRCDFDHQSEISNNTKASGWINDLAIDGVKGLVGKAIVTEAGANALNGLDYRYGSPAFAFDETDHPTKLLSFAYTNRPRIKDMDVVWNIDDIKKDLEQKEEIMETEKDKEKKSCNTEEAVEEKTEEAVEKTTPLDEIVNSILVLSPEAKVLLRLSENATEDEIKMYLDDILKNGDNDDVEEVVNSDPFNEKDNVVLNAKDAVKPDIDVEAALAKEYKSLPGGQAKVDFILKHKGFAY